MNMNEIIADVSMTKTITVKPFKDSEESKTITLVTKFDGVTMGAVFTDAMKSDVIRYQATARKNYDTLEDGATINRVYNAPPATVDPIAAVVGILAGKSDEEKKQWILDNLGADYS